jgi:hypothetical protein
MATLVNLRSLIPSIMPTWVLRKPALQIPMAVKTQIPLASIMPLSKGDGLWVSEAEQWRDNEG